ncbi:MAG: metallophosphoesterase [Elusimicrobiota bacterium]
MGNKTILVHLSDIHFGKPGHHGQFDLDLPLRNEVERDLVELRAAHGVMRGVVVSGDVAHSGKAEQYTTAQLWLGKVTSIIGCAPECVWVVPGNHDVDRDVINTSEALKDFHALVRKNGQAEVNEQLRKKAQDPIMGPALLKAMAHYNDFAAKFGCEIAPDKLSWQHDIVLNDGSTLRLVGLTSTWLSDERDSTGDNKLALGEAQLNLPRLDDVEYLTVCHHPPSWLLDQDVVQTKLRALARVQLFGHKHSQEVYRVENSLHITAGAVHPERQEAAWMPRYNLLTFEVTEAPDRKLRVEVYARVWSDAGHRFVAAAGGGGQAAVYEFNLSPRQRRAEQEPAVQPIVVAAAENSGGTAVEELPIVVPTVRMDHSRSLAFRFLDLPLHNRIEICHALGLLPARAAATIDTVFFTEAFKTAKSRGLLAGLWDAVGARDGKVAPNPYRIEVGG